MSLTSILLDDESQYPKSYVLHIPVYAEDKLSVVFQKK